MGRIESRGRLVSEVWPPNPPTCTSIIVSVRLPSTSPVESCCAAVSLRPARLSEPMISQLVPELEEPSYSGSAWMRVIWVSR